MKALNLKVAVAVLALGLGALNLGADEMKIILKNKNGEFNAVLEDTAAARDFAKLLPLKLNLKDYGGHEKVATLKTPLDISGSPRGTDGKKGEIAYFAPFKNFVIYYGYQPYYDGIVRLGKLEKTADIDKVAIDGEVIITK